MTQLLRIQALCIPMWHVIMIIHKKSGNWKIWINVNFYINNFQVINRFNGMEYNDQSHHPIVSLTPSNAPHNEKC
jgi:hypothetical protein